MPIVIICLPLLGYLGVRIWMKRPPTLAGFGVVYFAVWSVSGGVRVLTKCLQNKGEPITFDDADLMCVGFGIVSMIWISCVSIWKEVFSGRIGRRRSPTSQRARHSAEEIGIT